MQAEGRPFWIGMVQLALMGFLTPGARPLGMGLYSLIAAVNAFV